jgi:hypothetical protein
MAARPGDQVVFTNYKPKLLFKKKLTKSDLERMYLPRSEVSKICPAAFDRPSNESQRIDPIQLLVYDPNRTRWSMNLTETSDGRWRLSAADWGPFAREWNFSEGREQRKDSS